MCNSTSSVYRRMLSHVTTSSTCYVEKYMCLHRHTRKYNIYIRNLLFLHVYIEHWETPFIGHLNRYTHISRTHFAHICVRILSYIHICSFIHTSYSLTWSVPSLAHTYIHSSATSVAVHKLTWVCLHKWSLDPLMATEFFVRCVFSKPSVLSSLVGTLVQNCFSLQSKLFTPSTILATKDYVNNVKTCKC